MLAVGEDVKVSTGGDRRDPVEEYPLDSVVEGTQLPGIASRTRITDSVYCFASRDDGAPNAHCSIWVELYVNPQASRVRCPGEEPSE